MRKRAVQQRDEADEAWPDWSFAAYLGVLQTLEGSDTIVTSLVLLLLLAGSATASECASTKAGAPATLVVQVVDELWLPLPGAVVSARLQGEGTECVKAFADAEGIARLAAPKQGPYTIEAKMVGFKTKRVKAVRADTDASKSVPHVQIKLKIASTEAIL